MLYRESGRGGKLKLYNEKIESISEINYDNDVYDINVEDNHNYFIEGALVHNCHKLVLEGLFGTVNKVVSTVELQEKKQLADLKIFCLILKHGAIECKHASGMTIKRRWITLFSLIKEINLYETWPLV